MPSCHCDPTVDNYKGDFIPNLVESAVLMKLFHMDDKADQHMETVYTHCELLNRNNKCLSSACKAEAKFVFAINPDISAYWQSPLYIKTDPDVNFVHSSPTFDFEDTCQPLQDHSAGASVTEGRCCGVVPNSVRYNAASGWSRKDCCEVVGEVFSPLTQCCGSSGVFPYGSCD